MKMMELSDDLFNIDLDINFEDEKQKYNLIAICGLIEKTNSKDKVFLDFDDEVSQLSFISKNLPNKKECYKMLSFKGGWSALAFIIWVSNYEAIDELYISTFRVGKKHFEKLKELGQKSKIKKLYLITSDSQERIDSTAEYKDNRYNYYDYIKETCNFNNWKIKSFNTHAKIVLLKTKENYYVLETSSNMNENPKMEQFSFENDERLFLFYKSFFDEVFKNGNINN